VRGIIVAKDVDEGLGYAVRDLSNVSLLTYKVDFALTPFTKLDSTATLSTVPTILSDQPPIFVMSPDPDENKSSRPRPRTEDR
jgi:hypothetical protein